MATESTIYVGSDPYAYKPLERKRKDPKPLATPPVATPQECWYVCLISSVRICTPLPPSQIFKDTFD